MNDDKDLITTILIYCIVLLLAIPLFGWLLSVAYEGIVSILLPEVAALGLIPKSIGFVNGIKLFFFGTLVKIVFGSSARDKR